LGNTIKWQFFVRIAKLRENKRAKRGFSLRSIIGCTEPAGLTEKYGLREQRENEDIKILYIPVQTAIKILQIPSSKKSKFRQNGLREQRDKEEKECFRFAQLLSRRANRANREKEIF
jgi:hypothetical protein